MEAQLVRTVAMDTRVTPPMVKNCMLRKLRPWRAPSGLAQVGPQELYATPVIVS